MGRRLLILGQGLGLFLLLFLAGCGTLSGSRPNQPPRDSLTHFSLEARFALRAEAPYSEPQSANGRLSWEHGADGDHILIADPLGQGLADITSTPDTARLQTGDGQVRQAADAATLVREGLGYELPLAELPGWLIGRPASQGTLRRDDHGRPLALREPGWQIDYEYADDEPTAPPIRLTVRREADATLRHLELRLRIEEWQALP